MKVWERAQCISQAPCSDFMQASEQFQSKILWGDCGFTGVKDGERGLCVNKDDLWQGSDPVRVSCMNLMVTGVVGLSRDKQVHWWRCEPPSSSCSLPLTPASAAGSTVSPAVLVLAQLRLGLPATVATVIVAMVLLVERYRSRHAAGLSSNEPWLYKSLAACLDGWLVR